jgi:hypothetical protein
MDIQTCHRPAKIIILLENGVCLVLLFAMDFHF